MKFYVRILLKLSIAPRMARLVLTLGPDSTELAPRAGDPGLFPVKGKARHLKPLARLRLPGRIHAAGSPTSTPGFA
jgi:hypothetical protein